MIEAQDLLSGKKKNGNCTSMLPERRNHVQTQIMSVKEKNSPQLSKRVYISLSLIEVFLFWFQIIKTKMQKVLIRFFLF